MMLYRMPSDEERSAGVVAHFEVDGQRIRGTVSRGDIGLVVTSVTVEADLPGGVTHRALRDAPLAEVVRGVREYANMKELKRRGALPLLCDTAAVAGLFSPSDADLPNTSGRVTVTDELLRQVSLVFIEETGAGKDKRAIQRTAERFGRSEGTVRSWVSRARKDGWLEPGSKGRIGAEPGPRLLEWAATQLVNPEAVTEEARAIAAKLGAETPGVAKAAVRAFQDIDERELAYQLGLPLLEAAVAAQVLYGQPLSAEFRDRAARGGDTHAAAWQREIESEVRAVVARVRHEKSDAKDVTGKYVEATEAEG